ncbi:MAG: DUF4190 domain-containing protein [Candidatus Koribacter versatilis]|uniref:DUF4190 domain-containing protein n=1 Tax=Candidatus Korobacter versatilis TaxID=658062 RepID=A0A932A6Q9_9BACT|nr:DUF4190 domain-containing protein [Candidatus Koribacter versatilis]
MYCNNCGAVNEDKANFCVNCGAKMLAATAVVNPGAIIAGTAAPPTPAQMPPAVLPSAAPAAAWPAAPDQQAVQTSGKAVASLILALSNGLFMFFCFPLAILAVVFGHISRSEIAKSAGRLKGAGMALAGLIIGYAGLSVLPLLIIAAIAIPNLLGARVSANEAAAIGSLRNITTAAVTYQAEYPDKGYPLSLEALGTATGDQPAFIDSELASGSRSGYRFIYTPIDDNGDGMVEGYLLNADPISPGTTGKRHFFSDETGVIRVETSQMANKQSPQIE